MNGQGCIFLVFLTVWSGFFVDIFHVIFFTISFHFLPVAGPTNDFVWLLAAELSATPGPFCRYLGLLLCIHILYTFHFIHFRGLSPPIIDRWGPNACCLNNLCRFCSLAWLWEATRKRDKECNGRAQTNYALIRPRVGSKISPHIFFLERIIGFL